MSEDALYVTLVLGIVLIFGLSARSCMNVVERGAYMGACSARHSPADCAASWEAQ